MRTTRQRLFRLVVLAGGAPHESSRAPRRRVRSRHAAAIGRGGLGMSRPHDPQPQPLLSPREGEIIRLLSADKSCKEVAEVLHLSIRTVEHYLDRLKLRFGKRTLHGLVGHVVRVAQHARSGSFTAGNSSG